MNANTNSLCPRSAEQTSPRAPTFASSIFLPCIVCSNFSFFFVSFCSVFSYLEYSSGAGSLRHYIRATFVSFESAIRVCIVPNSVPFVEGKSTHFSFCRNFSLVDLDEHEKVFLDGPIFFAKWTQVSGRNGVWVFTRTCNFLFIHWWLERESR